MEAKLTIQERLKDLRVVERGLSLEQLAEQTGLSKSALGKYESEDFKDISPFAIVTLAKFYGVSTDYLLGLTENKNPANAELQALHLRDDAVDAIRDGKYNKRLLSELLVHDKFQQLMVDAEVYVDRIADSRINDMNAMLEAVRQQIIQQYATEDGDLHTRTLALAQIQTGEYFKQVLSDDLIDILSDIREAHKQDVTTADGESAAEAVSKYLQSATIRRQEIPCRNQRLLFRLRFGSRKAGLQSAILCRVLCIRTVFICSNWRLPPFYRKHSSGAEKIC